MRARSAIFVSLLAAIQCLGQQQTSGQPGAAASQQPAQDKSAQGTKTSPSEANPFPEDLSRKAADAANANKADSSSESSSHVDMKRLEDADRESRISDGAGGYIHSPELAAKDDKVGKYYFQTGDFKGAYDRYKEATLVAPEDADAVFGLAESARQLHLNDEAARNYTLYLDAFPDGKKSKDARKALAAIKAPSAK